MDQCFSQYIWITYFSVKGDEGVSTKDLNEDLNRTKIDFFNWKWVLIQAQISKFIKLSVGAKVNIQVTFNWLLIEAQWLN